jgi:membrane-associated phospholipid phosphatase
MAVFWLSSVFVVIVLWFSGQLLLAYQYGFSVLCMSVVVGALKLATNIDRPDGMIIKTHWKAFPSGHSAAAGLLLIMVPYVLYTLGDRVLALLVGIVVLCLCLAIVTSRILLVAHTYVQAVTGFCIGVLVALGTIYFFVA